MLNRLDYYFKLKVGVDFCPSFRIINFTNKLILNSSSLVLNLFVYHTWWSRRRKLLFELYDVSCNGGTKTEKMFQIESNQIWIKGPSKCSSIFYCVATKKESIKYKFVFLHITCAIFIAFVVNSKKTEGCSGKLEKELNKLRCKNKIFKSDSVSPFIGLFENRDLQ